jgi:predicted permease
VTLLRWLRDRFSTARLRREIESELCHHLESRIAEYQAAGLSRTDARQKALKRFGDITHVTTECSAVQGLPGERSGMMDNIWQDLRYSVRSLTRQPSFFFLAVTTLATGIAASTIVFSAVNSTLLNPIPFPGGDRWIETLSQHPGAGFMITSPQAAVGPWREQAHTLEALATYGTKRFLVAEDEEPRILIAAVASVELLPFLDVQPILGRGFLPEDTVPGQDHKLLLAERFWRQRYGADPDVLGNTLTLDGESFTIIGVLPRRADAFWANSPRGADSEMLEYGVWVPGANLSSTVARLRKGVDDSTAVSDLRRVHARLDLDPNTPEGWPIVVRRPIEDVSGDLKTGLWVLLGAVGFLMLVACVNVANMLLGRGLSRKHELAVRAAIGSSRVRAFRQMLVESLLLTGTAATVALVVAFVAIGAIRTSLPAGLADLHAIRIDFTVLAVTATIAVFTGLVFGLVPAAQILVLNLTTLLNQGHRSGSQMTSTSLRHGALVAAEVALATVLFVGAGLMTNSLLRLQHHDPGIDPTNMISFNIDLPETRYASPAERASFFLNLLDGLRDSPAVVRAAIGGVDLRGREQGKVLVEGLSDPMPDRGFDVNLISDEYLATLRMRLSEGREFSRADVAENTNSVIVNEVFARIHWPGDVASGKRFRFEESEGWFTVLGVFESFELSGLSSRSHIPQIYKPFAAWPLSDHLVTVRTHADPRSVLPILKGILWTLDPELPMHEITFASDMLDEAIALPRFNALLLITFAAVALLLAAVGVYGVVSLTLQHRLHELGVRIALGAENRDIFALILGHGMRPVVLGAVLGVAGAFGLARFLRSLLFEVEPSDPITYLVVVGLLGAAAFAACYLPSRRATRVDPVEVLRQQ